MSTEKLKRLIYLQVRLYKKGGTGEMPTCASCNGTAPAADLNDEKLCADCAANAKALEDAKAAEAKAAEAKAAVTAKGVVTGDKAKE